MRDPLSKFIRMVAKLLYRHLEDELLKFIPTAPAKEHVIDVATSCILGKSTSELLCVITVLQPTRYEQISALTNSDFKYRLNSLLHECKDIFEGTVPEADLGLPQHPR